MKSLYKIILMSALVLICNMTYANTIPLTNCSQLKAPNTVLLVHASWCRDCQEYKPVYTELSNNPKYAKWKFYQVENNDFHSICGTEIDVLPMTFKNNMHSPQIGYVSLNGLKEYLR